MFLYKKIQLIVCLILGASLSSWAQSGLAQAKNPEYHKVPSLTGDADKDAEIKKVAAIDLAKYEVYRAKMYEVLGGKFNAAQEAYAESMGMPKFTYSGIAENDWQQYKNAFKIWAKTNQAQMPAIQQRLIDLSKN